MQRDECTLLCTSAMAWEWPLNCWRVHRARTAYMLYKVYCCLIVLQLAS